MTIYVFGNEDLDFDNLAINLVRDFGEEFKDIDFKFVKPNQDLPFASGEDVYILDQVQGLDRVKIFTEEDVDKLVLAPRTSVHDFDLGFQLKYLKKLGRLGKVKIIGLPLATQSLKN